MPQIPEFDPAAVPAPGFNARVDPQALAAPGRATEEGGRQLEQVGREVGQLVDYHNQQAYNEARANATDTAFTTLDAGKEAVRQGKEPFAGFTQRQLDAFDQLAQQHKENGPGGLYGSRLDRSLAV